MAQGIGATLSVASLVLSFGFGNWSVGRVVLALVIPAAFLESVFGYCLGSKTFGLLMRTGIIPPSACEDCDDIWRRTGAV